MILKFSMDYSERELEFLQKHGCEILSEMTLSRVDFGKNQFPRRMFRYGGAYIAEMTDEESNDFVWAALSKWKGVYHFSEYYDSLESLEQGM